MKWRRIIPTCITLGILWLGFESILKSMAGAYMAAAQLIVLAGILDGLDGEVARLFRGVTTFGAKLDSYVDAVTFGVAPAVMAYAAVWGEFGGWGLLFAFAILASGVIRFARYQVKEARVKQHTFRGLPIPVSAIWMSMLILFSESSILLEGKFFLDKPTVVLLMWVCTIAFLLLQVSNVRYAKPTKEMIAVGLIGAALLMAVMRNPVLGFCLATCIALLVFAFAVPFHLLRHLEEEDAEEEHPVKLRRWFR